MKRLRIFSGVVLLAILAAACTPIAAIPDLTGRTAMTVVYDVTHATVSGAWGWVAWIWGLTISIGLAVLVYKLMVNGWPKIVFQVTTLVVVGILTIGGMTLIFDGWATATATHAVQVGADRAKTRKANQYVEKLHLPATKAVLVPRTCNEVDDGGTGCRYEWVYDHDPWTECTSHDKNGNCDGWTTYYHHMHVPYFKQEVRAVGYFSMPDEYLLDKVGEDAGTGLTKSDIPNMPLYNYTDWQAPENYDVWWYGKDHLYGHTPDPIGAFDYQIPPEFTTIQDALRHGRPYIITVTHRYVNWVFITRDTNNLVATSSLVDKYLAAGLLPQINMPYSRWNTAGLNHDYDFVQFLGGLKLPGAQDEAGTAALWIGPKLQGSLLMWFVPASAVDNPDALIQAAKTYLSDPAKWALNMAPKNLILIVCGVSQDSSIIKWCRSETGMPTGNVDLRYTLDHLHDVPFTNLGVFGTITATATVGDNGFYTTKVVVGTDGIIGLLKDFKRVSMSGLDWLKTDIKLDRSDIVWAVTTETESARDWALFWDIAGILVACGVAYGLYQMPGAEGEDHSNRRYYRGY